MMPLKGLGKAAVVSSAGRVADVADRCPPRVLTHQAFGFAAMIEPKGLGHRSQFSVGVDQLLSIRVIGRKSGESWPRFWISSSIRGISRETSCGPCEGQRGLAAWPGSDRWPRRHTREIVRSWRMGLREMGEGVQPLAIKNSMPCWAGPQLQRKLIHQQRKRIRSKKRRTLLRDVHHASKHWRISLQLSLCEYGLLDRNQFPFYPPSRNVTRSRRS